MFRINNNYCYYSQVIFTKLKLIVYCLLIISILDLGIVYSLVFIAKFKLILYCLLIIDH